MLEKMNLLESDARVLFDYTSSWLAKAEQTTTTTCATNTWLAKSTHSTHTFAHHVKNEHKRQRPNGKVDQCHSVFDVD